MRESRNRRVPEDVLTSLSVPLVGQVLSFGDSGSMRTSKRRPASFRARGPRRGTGVRSECDLARRPGNRLTLRKPCAAIDYHPAWHAFIRDNIKRHAVAVSIEAILSRPIASAGSTSHRELNFIALSFPASVEFGPAFSLERERPGGIEAHDESAERQRSGRNRGFAAMRLDVLLRKLEPVGALAQADLFGFGLCVFDLPAVAQHAPDHPERADANRRSAMNKDRAVVWIVGDFQKLRDLLFVGITVRDGDVEVAQAQLFRFRFFLRGGMFAWLAQVEDRLPAFVLELFEMLETWLPAGAEVFILAQEVPNRTGILGHRRRQDEQQNRQNVNRFVLIHFCAFCAFLWLDFGFSTITRERRIGRGS